MAKNEKFDLHTALSITVPCHCSKSHSARNSRNSTTETDISTQSISIRKPTKTYHQSQLPLSPLPVPPHGNVDISKYEEEKCLWQAVILLPELCQESVNIITFYPPI